MPSYAYRAVHASGRVARGRMAAANENELAHYLGQSGMELIEAREQKRRVAGLPLLRQGIGPRALSVFCTRMNNLLQAGILFPEALHEVTATTENTALREALTQIGLAMANGCGIAASFALYPRLFPSVFTSIIGAGEKSGDMQAVFRFLARFAEDSARTQERLRRALRYPLFLFAVAGGAVIFMMTAVVPQVVAFLESIQGAVPLATRILMGVSGAFTRYGAAAGLALAIACTSGFAAYRASALFARRVDAVLLRLPFIGKVIVKSSMARFAHNFSILFRSGCEVVDCLHQAGATIANRALRAEIENAAGRVHSGSALSAALAGVMPSFAVGMMRTGEKSGRLATALDEIAAAYDREAQDATDNFIGVLEPMLTLVIGGVLAWTVMAMLGPLYGSLSVLGSRM